MSDFDRLRQVAEQAADARRQMRPIDRDYYAMPEPGAFVGEHTKAVVMDALTVLALLDVAEAAGYADTKWTTRREDGWSCGGCGSTYDFTSLMADRCPACRIRSALDRLREATT